MEDKENISLKSLIINCINNWKIFLIAFVISIVIGVCYLNFYPKTYEIMALIRLENDKDLGSSSLALGDVAGIMESFGIQGKTGSINMDDEIMIFTSNNLISKTVRDLGINVLYKKPYMYNFNIYQDTPIQLKPDSITDINLEASITFDIKIDKHGKVIVKTKTEQEKNTYSYSSLPANIKMKEGNFDLVYTNEEVTPYSMKIEVHPAGWIAEDLASQITIEESSKTSNTIELVCEDHEKKRGVDFLNTLIDKYNEQENGYKKEEGLKSIAFLEYRIESVKRQMVDQEYNIEKYKNLNQVTFVESDVQFYSEQMQALYLKIIELESYANIVNLLDEYVNAPENHYKLIPSLLSSTEGGESGSAIMLYNQAIIERARLRENSEKENPLLSNYDFQVDKLRESVVVSIKNAKQGIEFSLNDLRSKEKTLMDKLESVPALEREYIDLKRQQEIYQTIYLILLQKREEIALLIGEDTNKARIIEPAYVKYKIVAPRKLFVAIFVFVFTLFIPIMVLFFREQIRVILTEIKQPHS